MSECSCASVAASANDCQAASDRDRLLRRKAFFVTPYGRGLWVSMWADEAIDWKLVADLLQRSYRAVALKRMIAALDTREHRDIR